MATCMFVYDKVFGQEKNEKRLKAVGDGELSVGKIRIANKVIGS